MQGLLVMVGTMIALGMWLFVIGVSPAETKPGKFRLFLTMAFGFTLTFSGFFAFAFVSGLGPHLAAINMFLFGIACWQYTLRTIALYSVARESVAPAPDDFFDDGYIRLPHQPGFRFFTDD